MGLLLRLGLRDLLGFSMAETHGAEGIKNRGARAQRPRIEANLAKLGQNYPPKRHERRVKEAEKSSRIHGTATASKFKSRIGKEKTSADDELAQNLDPKEERKSGRNPFLGENPAAAKCQRKKERGPWLAPWMDCWIRARPRAAARTYSRFLK